MEGLVSKCFQLGGNITKIQCRVFYATGLFVFQGPLSGVYTCIGENSLGSSPVLTIRFLVNSKLFTLY